jgi:hypothetical protein
MNMLYLKKRDEIMRKLNQNREVLFLITPDQFGYHTDDYYRAYYAKRDYEVHMICYDHGKEKIELAEINVTYVPYENRRIKNEVNMHRTIKRYIRDKGIKIIYTRFFISCAFLRIFNLRRKTKWILDIRTGAVSENIIKRRIYNSIIRLSSRFYRNVTIISESLAKELKIKKYSVVPLGGQPLVKVNEVTDTMDAMNFLYVGVFDGRKIDSVINAYCKFYRKYSQMISTKLTIVGYSNDFIEEKKIIELINNNQDICIEFVGRVPNMKLKKYFMESNIGLSYVPLTPWFDVQPPTKTFEYIVNGLFCLATDTKENRLVITKDNGILVQDTEKSVFEGMKEIFQLRLNYNRDEIIVNAANYTWESIYNSTIQKVLEEKYRN